MNLVEDYSLTKSIYIDEKGHEVKYEDFEKFVPKQKASASQGIEDQIKIRTYKLSNIRSVRLYVDENLTEEILFQ